MDPFAKSLLRGFGKLVLAAAAVAFTMLAMHWLSLL